MNYVVLTAFSALSLMVGTVQAESCNAEKMKAIILRTAPAALGVSKVRIESFDYVKTPADAVLTYNKRGLDATCYANAVVDTYECKVLEVTAGNCFR